MERLEHQKKVSEKALSESRTLIEHTFGHNADACARIVFNVAAIGNATGDDVALYSVANAICKIKDPDKAANFAFQLRNISNATKSSEALILAAGILDQMHENLTEATIRIASICRQVEHGASGKKEELFRSMTLLGPSMLR